MIGRLRQLSEPRLRQQAGTEKSQTPVERDIFVQWVRSRYLSSNQIVIATSDTVVFLPFIYVKCKANSWEYFLTTLSLPFFTLLNWESGVPKYDTLNAGN